MTRKVIGVVGAGNVGATCAFELARRELGNVVMVDIVEGMPAGKALDMSQAGSQVGFDTHLQGATNNYDALDGADLVVITAGVPRKPGMDRADLLEKNAKIVGGVVDRVANVAPESIIICVSNPLDVMSYLALRKSSFPKSRVLGMAGALDTARFQFFLADEIGCSVRDVRAMVLGGHGDSMVPAIRYATVHGIPVSELISEEKLEAIVDRTRKGGGEIVGLLDRGSAFYAPGASIAAMVASILRDQRRILPCAAYLEGEYGLDGVYCGVPCLLGAEGVERIYELDLTDEELEALATSARHVEEGQAVIDEMFAETGT